MKTLFYKQLILKVSLSLLFVVVITSHNFAQVNQNHPTGHELAIRVFKFLGRTSDIKLLKNKEPYYAFNLRIKVTNKNNILTVDEVAFSKSIGKQIFLNIDELKEFDYYSLINKNSSGTILIPILILNNSFDAKNQDDSISNFTKKSLINFTSSLFYPDILQKDIILFPVFTINRLEIP